MRVDLDGCPIPVFNCLSTRVALRVSFNKCSCVFLFICNLVAELSLWSFLATSSIALRLPSDS